MKKYFDFPRRITVNYETLRYFRERAEKRREILSHDTSFIYAHTKRVRAYFLCVNGEPLPFVSRFLLSPQCIAKRTKRTRTRKTRSSGVRKARVMVTSPIRQPAGDFIR